MKGVGMATDFGTKVDVGEWSIGCKLNLVEKVGAERSDKVVGMLAKVGVLWEEVDEISN